MLTAFFYLVFMSFPNDLFGNPCRLFCLMFLIFLRNLRVSTRSSLFLIFSLCVLCGKINKKAIAAGGSSTGYRKLETI